MILNVENLTHGFGDRAIFNNVSFRLLAGEHIGLVGANGEGKSTFMNIVTGALTPDEGKVEWNKHVRVGYLDQHAVLQKGMTIESVLKSAFAYLYEMEEKINQIYESMADATEEQIAEMMDEVGTRRKRDWSEFAAAGRNDLICVELYDLLDNVLIYDHQVGGSGID